MVRHSGEAAGENLKHGGIIRTRGEIRKHGRNGANHGRLVKAGVMGEGSNTDKGRAKGVLSRNSLASST